MPTTSTYSPTGDPYLDGVLSGVKWGVNTLTFSFPTDSSFYGSSYGGGENLNMFEAFTGVQQAAMRSILQMYSSYANLTFVEVTESATTHGDLRYAESDSPNTAWAYYPSTSALGGDAWFNNSKGHYDNPAPGNYAWLTMMHETGHALGLKHPHEASGTFAALPLDHDSLEYSVMSYRSYVGGSTSYGYTNGSTSYPQTLMMYDIAAIQKMYGADFTTNAGDTTYNWSVTTGQMSINGAGQWMPGGNKIFMTLWDGGGNDTYDFTNYSGGVSVDLNPGAWTVTLAAQLASLGSGKYAIGNIANALLFNGNLASLIENAFGGAGADTLTGNVGDNRLMGMAGNDMLNGGGGNDTAVFSGSQSNYSWAQSGDSWTITDLRGGTPDGVDTLKGIEYLAFSDGNVTIGAPTTPIDPPRPPPPPPAPTNIAPVAVGDVYSVAKGKSLTITKLSGLLKNDSDANGDALNTILVSGPGKGNLKFAADGSFVYTPAKNFSGTVSFTYRANDGTDSSNLATVTIAVGTTTTAGNAWHGAGEDQVPAPATSTLHSWLKHGAHDGTGSHEPSFDFDHHANGTHAFHDFVF